MALTLKTSGIATQLLLCFAVDTDDTIKEFVNGWTDGSGFTMAGVTVGTAASWNGHSIKPMVVASSANNGFALTTPVSFNWYAAGGSSAYVAASNYAHTDNGAHFFSDSLTDDDHAFMVDSLDRVQVFALSTRAYSTTTVSTSGAMQSFGWFYEDDGTNNAGVYYGLASGSGSIEGTSTWGNVSYDRLCGFVCRASASHNRNAAGSYLLLAMFTGKLTESDFDALHADPIGTLFQASAPSAVLMGQAVF